jgi:putative acetyltransferase
MTTRHTWNTSAESRADIPTIRTIDLAAFDTAHEADLVEALREAPAWIDGLSIIAADENGTVVGHALLTRCHIGETPALCLGPVAVPPEHQKTGAGGAAIRAGLRAAADHGERFVTVLGHPPYYPRFGFHRASEFGISVTMDVPDEALMALTLDERYPLPSGTIRYAAPFGV